MRSGPVTAVKFASEGIVASSSTDGSTKFWDLGTGQETEKTAEAVPEGFTLLPDIISISNHPHVLTYSSALVHHGCDLCGRPIQHDGYRCRDGCDFDVCTKCASKQIGTKERSINSYVVAAKGKTLCIFKAADEAETAPKVEAEEAEEVEAAEAEETAAVAFFQCASEIQAFDVCELERSQIAVGCADGQVLQLRAAVLLT